MRYYISDLHFFHESLNTQMDCRGFKDAAQMNAYMIKQWNSRVRPKDEVVILGDFSVGKAKETNEVLSQLNGTLYMIKGNHDSYLKAVSYTHLDVYKRQVLAVLIAFSRLYLYVHYPTDVLGGIITGAIAGYIGYKLTFIVQSKHRKKL